MQRSPVQLGQLLTAPRPVASLDYMTVQADEADLRATVEWPVTRAGTGHGLSLGINRTFADGVCLSTSPEVEQPGGIPVCARILSVVGASQAGGGRSDPRLAAGQADGG